MRLVNDRRIYSTQFWVLLKRSYQQFFEYFSDDMRTLKSLFRNMFGFEVPLEELKILKSIFQPEGFLNYFTFTLESRNSLLSRFWSILADSRKNHNAEQLFKPLKLLCTLMVAAPLPYTLETIYVST